MKKIFSLLLMVALAITFTARASATELPINVTVSNIGDQSQVQGVTTDITVSWTYSYGYDYFEVWGNGVKIGSTTNKSYTFTQSEPTGDLTVTDIKVRAFYSSGGGYSEYAVYGDYTVVDIIANNDPFNVSVMNTIDSDADDGVTSDITVSFDFVGSADYIEVWADGVKVGNAHSVDNNITFTKSSVTGDLVVTDIKVRAFYSSLGGFQNFVVFGDYLVTNNDNTIIEDLSFTGGAEPIGSLIPFRIVTQLEYDSIELAFNELKTIQTELSLFSDYYHILTYNETIYKYSFIDKAVANELHDPNKTGNLSSYTLSPYMNSAFQFEQLYSIQSTDLSTFTNGAKTNNSVETNTYTILFSDINITEKSHQVLFSPMTITDTFTVNYYNYNGDLLKTVDVVPNGSSTPPTAPTREGYNFIGWSNDGSLITDDINIYASFNINEYTVNFKDHDGTILKSELVQHGNGTTPPNDDPTRDGYIFLGWDSSYTYIIADTDVIAQYSGMDYTVTFKNYSGAVLKIEQVESGSNATAPTVPIREGYTFDSWDTVFTGVTSDLTVNATFIINTYTVQFLDHDGSVLDTMTVNHGNGATPPVNPTWVDHVFSGWSVDYNNIVADTDVIAQYDLETFEITFLDYDGSFIETVVTTINTDSSLPTAPVREGYTFTGWSEGYQNVTANMTVLAQYEVSTYTVTFNNYDGSELGTSTVEHNKPAVVGFDLPTREGYQFSGWSHSIEQITEDITVTAIFELPSHRVAFMWQGIIIDTQDVLHGFDAEEPSTNREGYTFLGWSDPLTNITESITILATYERSSYTVNFLNEGVVLKTQTVLHGNSATPPTEDPTRDGYYFRGWEAYWLLDSIRADMDIDAIWGMVDPADYPVVENKRVQKPWFFPNSINLKVDFVDTVDYERFEFYEVLITVGTTEYVVKNGEFVAGGFSMLADDEQSSWSELSKTLDIAIPFGSYGITKDTEVSDVEIVVVRFRDTQTDNLLLNFDYRDGHIGSVANLVESDDVLLEPVADDSSDEYDLYDRGFIGRLLSKVFKFMVRSDEELVAENWEKRTKFLDYLFGAKDLTETDGWWDRTLDGMMPTDEIVEQNWFQRVWDSLFGSPIEDEVV